MALPGVWPGLGQDLLLRHLSFRKTTVGMAWLWSKQYGFRQMSLPLRFFCKGMETLLAALAEVKCDS